MPTYSQAVLFIIRAYTASPEYSHQGFIIIMLGEVTFRTKPEPPLKTSSVTRTALRSPRFWGQ